MTKAQYAVQAASAAAPGLKAPSSLAVGAAIPTTKQAVFSQADAAQPAPTEAGGNKAPSSAAAPTGKASQPAAAAAAAMAKSDKPAVERRSLEGLDKAVANGLRALCQVTHKPLLHQYTDSELQCVQISTRLFLMARWDCSRRGAVCNLRALKDPFMRTLGKVFVPVLPPCDI